MTFRIVSIAAFTGLFTLLGCAGEKPIIDSKGVNPNQYEQDLAECTEYVDEVETGSKVATGVVAGAAVGAVLGEIWKGGYYGANAGRGAATGAVLGGTGGVTGSVAERKQVIRNCLRGRGYRVLN